MNVDLRFFTLLLAWTLNVDALHSPKRRNWRALFDEILSTLEQEQPRALENEPLMTKALDSFVKNIDPYASFLDTHSHTALKELTRGEAHRIGLVIGPKRKTDDFLMIVHVKKGSPAEQQGILRYDKIKAINGIPVGPFSLEENRARLEGTTQEPLKLLITRNQEEPRLYTLQNCFMSKKSCQGSVIAQHDLLYCKINLFTTQTTAQLEEILLYNVTKNTKGIILDVRANSGGLLEAALTSVALFVEKNSLILTTKNLHNQTGSYYRTERDPCIKRAIPLIILVNQDTASAAEVFAQALRVYASEPGRKLFVGIVGSCTAGKGSLQKVHPLSSSHALKLTTAYCSMGDGSCFHKKGITPDFYLEEEDEATAQKSKQFLKDSLQPLTSTTEQLLLSDPFITCASTLVKLLRHLHTYTPQLTYSYKNQLSWLQAHYHLPSRKNTRKNVPVPSHLFNK